MSEIENVFAQKLAAARAKAGIKLTPAPVPVPATTRVEYDADLIPSPQDEGLEDPNEGIVDALIDRIGIIDGYKRWIGGLIEEPRGRTESIMCQCPYPNHTDEKPSAWVNTLNNTFYCGGCSRGGDQLTLAAIKYGYVQSAQQSAPTGKAFHDLRRHIAAEFGIEAIRFGDGPWRYVVAGPDSDADRGLEPALPSVSGVAGDSHGEQGAVDPAVREERAGEAPASTAGHVRLDNPGVSPVHPVDGAVLGGDEGGDGEDRGGSDGSEARVPGDLSTPAATPPPAPVAGNFTLKIPKKPFQIAETKVPQPAREPEQPPLASVTSITGEDLNLDKPPEASLPGLDWTKIVPEGTYLDAVMQATRVDDVPEEYHFWHAMVSVGLALGRDVTTEEIPSVTANLFLCILGKTGAGKSKSRSHFDKIFKEALPFDEMDTTNDGVHLIGTPGSGEVMVQLFTRSIPDPLIKGKINRTGNIRGLVDFNEFSALTSRAGRPTSTLESTLISFYDAKQSISTNTKGDGTIDAKNSFCSIMTTTQPASLAGLVSQTDATSGFLNRWLFVTGTPKRPQSIVRGTVDMSEPIRLMKKITEWTSPTRTIPWGAAADKKYDDFFHSTIHPLKMTDDTSLLSRADLLMKKLILIFTGNIASKDEDLAEIPESAVDQAIACWPYLVACYAIVDDRIVTSKLREVENLILVKVNESWTGKKNPLSARDIYQKVKRKVGSMEELAKILRSLADLGLIERVQTNSGKVGRPVVKFYPAGAL